MSQLVIAQIANEKVSNFDYPQFLNSRYFEEILKKFNNDSSLKVERVQVGPCGVAGEAFASTMYRVEVFATKGNNRELKRGNYVVKMMPTLQLAVDKLGAGNYNVQKKEMDIFQNILPEFKRVLKEIGCDKNVFPIAIAVDRVKDVLILEDLAVKRFEMADRRVGLDMEHLKLGLEKLARFHAASMIVLDESPDLFNGCDVGMFSRKCSAFHTFFSSNYDALTAEVSSWTGYEVYGRKLKELKETFFERTYKVFDNENGDMKVLNHGDLWLNNFMFVYGKRGLPKDSIIFCCVAHPAVDLLYFLYTSSTDEIRRTKILELTQFYFYELKEVLTKLKYNLARLPTLHQFQLQVMKKYFYAFPSSMVIFPVMISNDSETIFENMHTTTAKALAHKRRLYKNPDLQKIIKSSLPTFDVMGLLDVV